MSKINISALVLLATASSNAADDIPVPVHMQGAFQRAQEKRKAQAEEDAVEMLMELMKSSEQATEIKTNQLRRLRRQEQSLRAEMRELERAKSYAQATGNYLPWAVQVGVISQFCVEAEDRHLCTVPVDWKPE